MTLEPPDIPYLKHLILELPKELPLGTAKEFPFSNYVPKKHDEGIGAAISKSVKDAFGWDAPIQSAITLTMTARGEHVAAVADVLLRYLRKSDSQDRGILEQVGRKLIQLATDTYREHNLDVREALHMLTSVF